MKFPQFDLIAVELDDLNLKQKKVIGNLEKIHQLLLSQQAITDKKEVGLRTKIISRENFVVRDEELFGFVGLGKLREFLLLSTSKDYSIAMRIDGVPVERQLLSFQELMDISPYIDFIVATQSNDNYILHVSDISFREYLYIWIKVKEEMTFSRVLLLAELLEVE